MFLPPTPIGSELNSFYHHQMMWTEDSGDEDDPQLSDFSKKQLLAQCHLRITQNNGDETAEIDDNTPEVDSTSAFGSPSSNDWKRSEGENEKQHALRQKVKNFKAP